MQIRRWTIWTPPFSSPPVDANEPNLSHATSKYLGYLDLATRGTQESAVDDFAAATLKLLGFDERHAMVTTRYAIALDICGEIQDAQTDVCVIYRPTAILLVLVRERLLHNKMNAEAQVVAEAIAAFQFNNRKRQSRGQPTPEAITIPCIAMSDTNPTFYLVPVTKELSDAVMIAQYPTTPTRVLMCVTIAADQRRFSDGMLDTEFRKLALKRFVEFRNLAKGYW